MADGVGDAPAPNEQRSSPQMQPTESSRQDEAFYRRRLSLGPACGGGCPQNRPYDPFCLCRLDQCVVEEKPSNRVGTPAGLRNMGQTCYLNSFLQTLFHIVPVRRILYEWRRPAARNGEPTAAEEVQRVFARLQRSAQSAVSPGGLVDAIGVDATRQQDAQEFSLLLVEWIDKEIAERPKEEKLQRLFAGKSRSIIKCRFCRAESKTECVLADLCLQINDVEDLKGAMEQYFATEAVDNYACEKCKERGTADKTTQLLEIPRFLNVHLCRYHYDKESKKRKKLTHSVSFPRTLDLKPYLSEEQAEEWGEEGRCYELIAVLIHQGNAEEGHYYARIRAGHDRKWYTFDDEAVSPYDPTRGQDEDSFGAYMLVYEKLRDVEKSPRIPDVPDHIDVSDHVPFTDWRLVQLNRFLKTLRVKPGSEGMAWLPTAWLARVSRALAAGVIDGVVVGPDLSGHICGHHRLGEASGLKAIDQGQAERLLRELEVLPRPRRLQGRLYCACCTKITIAPPARL